MGSCQLAKDFSEGYSVSPVEDRCSAIVKMSFPKRVQKFCITRLLKRCILKIFSYQVEMLVCAAAHSAGDYMTE